MFTIEIKVHRQVVNVESMKYNNMFNCLASHIFLSNSFL